MRCKKIEKKYAPKKIITENNIYVVQQFTYILGVAGISLFSGKKKKSNMQLYNFFLSKEQHQNPNLQASVPWIKSQKISH